METCLANTSELIRMRYEFLRSVARRFLRREPAGFDLAPTDLVHEACLKLLGQPAVKWQNTAHFRGILLRKMRQALVDHVRLSNSKKRGGGGRQASASPRSRVDENPGEASPVDETNSERAATITIAGAMRALEQESVRLWLTVGLRFLCGLSNKTTACYLGVCESTVEKDLRYASAWLRSRLSGPES